MIDPRGLNLIKRFEGLYLTRYLCAAGVPTIGYGSTHWWDGGPIPEGATLKDEAEALKLMALELLPTEMAVRTGARKSSEAHVAAMTSLAYNIGVTGWRGSTLRRKHNAGDYPGAADQFPRWNKAGGRVLPGLTRRRVAESNLYAG